MILLTSWFKKILYILATDNCTDLPVVSMMNNISMFGGNRKTTDNRTHVSLIVSWPRKVKPNTYIKYSYHILVIFFLQYMTQQGFNRTQI